MTIEEQIQFHHDEACKLAFDEIKRLAYKILDKSKSFNCFCMAMGSWSFHDKNGPIWDYDKRVKEMDDFIQEWGYTLNILGWPIKIDRVNGEYVEKRSW